MLRISTLELFHVVLFGILVFPGTLHAQDPAISSLIISARSQDEPLDLTAADLQIKEDGKAVQIQRVRKLGRLPIQYCVLFDVSGSSRGLFKAEKESATGLIQKIWRSNTDQGWLTLFSDVSASSKETADPSLIIEGINRAKSGAATALYDAISECAAGMGQRRQDSPLRVILLFSDGGDNASRVTRDEALQSAVLAGARIYGFSPNDPFTRFDSLASRGTNIMKALTASTGGELFSSWKVKKIDTAATAINEELGNMFGISYRGEPSAGKPLRRIEIHCSRTHTTIVAPMWVYPQSQDH